MELRDGQIVLRPWREDDAEVVYLACQDSETQHGSVTGDRARAASLAITEEEVVLGSVGLSIVTDKTGDVGYWCISETPAKHHDPRGAARVPLRFR